MPSPAWAIRSMAMHPTLPLFAATGLDRKCHVFELESRTKLATTFLKQRQSALLFSNTARVVLDTTDTDEGPVRKKAKATDVEEVESEPHSSEEEYQGLELSDEEDDDTVCDDSHIQRAQLGA